MTKTLSKITELEKLLPGIEHNVPLAPYTTFKIGGPADYFYHARTPDGLVKAITTARWSPPSSNGGTARSGC